MERIVHYFYDAIAVDEYMWFIEDDMNALFKMNIGTLKMEYVLSFPNETAMSRLYRFIGRIDDKLICCPRNAGAIVIYNIDSGSMETISADFSRYKDKSARMYGDGISGNMIYMPRQGYSEIYQLDVQSGKLSILNVIDEKVDLGVNDYFWHGRIRRYQSDTEIILYSIKQNAFYRYNLLTCGAQKIKCFKEDCKLIDFVVDGHFVWGLCDDGMLYKWDGFRVIEQYRYKMTGAETAELLQYKNKIYVMDVVTGKIILSLGADDETEDISFQIPDNNTGLFNYCFNEGYFLLQWKDGMFYYYDGVNEVSGIFESDLADIPATAFLPKEVCIERQDFSLQKLLRIVKYQPDSFKSDPAVKVGTHIYNSIVTD